MKVLFDAIKAKFNIDNPLKTDLSGRLYFMQAPQTAVFPYCVYSPISDMYEYNFTADFENIVVQFSIFSTDENAVNIESYFGHLKDLYDWGVLSVTGYTHVYMRREQSRLLKDDRAWHRQVDYRIFLEKN